MGIFSNLFKSKTGKTFASEKFGILTLVYSKGKKNLWTTDFNGLNITIQGTEEEPNAEQLKLLENLDNEIKKLDEKITKKFMEEFSEADLAVDFNHWKDRFEIVGVEIMLIFESEAYWNITFEDLKSPYAHFTLFIEGQRLTDFSIDT